MAPFSVFKVLQYSFTYPGYFSSDNEIPFFVRAQKVLKLSQEWFKQQHIWKYTKSLSHNIEEGLLAKPNENPLKLDSSCAWMEFYH